MGEIFTKSVFLFALHKNTASKSQEGNVGEITQPSFYYGMDVSRKRWLLGKKSQYHCTVWRKPLSGGGFLLTSLNITFCQI